MRRRIDSPSCAAPLDEALLLDHVEHGERGGLRNGIADVRSSDRGVAGRVHDLGGADHAGERQPGGDRLRDRHQVGLDAVVLRGEHSTGASEARLHLVDDEDDAVLVADPAQPDEEVARRGEEAGLALDGLDDERGDLLGGDLRRERALERR